MTTRNVINCSFFTPHFYCPVFSNSHHFFKEIRAHLPPWNQRRISQLNMMRRETTRAVGRESRTSISACCSCRCIRWSIVERLINLEKLMSVERWNTLARICRPSPPLPLRRFIEIEDTKQASQQARRKTYSLTKRITPSSFVFSRTNHT